MTSRALATQKVEPRDELRRTKDGAVIGTHCGTCDGWREDVKRGAYAIHARPYEFQACSCEADAQAAAGRRVRDGMARDATADARRDR